ncbi:MAG: VWA domain-containing protein [Myxococcales bacterium]|nr:VWA domain-containing protein [Myxococcales bacterium]
MATSTGRLRLMRGVCVCSLACAFGLAAACSGADEAPNQGVSGGSGGAQGGSSGSGANGASGGSGGSAGSGGFIDAGDGDALDPDAACGLVTERGQAFPLNLYIMLDKSNSMSGYKWDAIKDGITAFVNDADSAGLNVALNFFPRSGPASCDQNLFKEPSVAFGQLPGHAQSIIDAVNGEAPNGLGTTTYPALGGAILKGIENGQNDPTTKNAVLLVTDGNPQWPTQPPPTCGSSDNPESTQAIANLAAAGYGFTPSVATFVVGLDGVQTNFANAVASAGGSGKAILISSTNAAQEFKDALKKVRGQALPCEYTLPSDVEEGKIAYDQVNVIFTPGTGSQETLLQTEDCNSGGGWYYDDPSMPTQILLCPSACEQVKSDFDAGLDILLGCKTERVK